MTDSKLADTFVSDTFVSELRRDTVRDFYDRTIGMFDNPKDKIVFIQCVAALDEHEGLDMYDMYIEDFNTALNQYRKVGHDTRHL